MRHPSRLSAVLLVLVVVILLPATTNVATGALPDSWQPHLWIAWPLAAVLVIPVAITEVRRQGRRREPVADGATAEIAPGMTVWNAPPLLRTFTDRETVLGSIAEVMSDRGAGSLVLVGWPGVGKTQIAAAYAAAHRAEFDIGWWIAAENRLAVIAGLAQLADRLRIGADDQEEAARRALRSLEERRRWLLVFDNVTDERDLAGLVPADSGQVLVTSRDPGLERLGTVVKVEPFDSVVAERFLLTRTHSTDRTAAANLAAELGGLPLALEQAAAYCASAGVTMAGYLPRYRENHDRLLRQGAHAQALPMQTTLLLAVRRARRRDRAAVQLLSICSFFAASAGIPRWLIDADPGLLPTPLRWVAQDVISLDTAIAVLVRLSLVQADGDLLRIHPVVQDAIRDQLARPGRLRRGLGRWILLTAELIVAALPGDPGDPAGWDRWVLAMPHALRVADHAARTVSAPTGRLRHRVGAYLLHRGEYPLALGLLDAAVAELTTALGPDDRQTLTARSDRARVLVDQGKVDAGGQEHEAVLALRRRVLGPTDRDTLISMNNVGYVWYRQGRMDEARRCHEENLAERRRVLGPEHPDTLISMGNLALVLLEQGELAKARQLHEKSLVIRRRVLGEHHPVVLESMNSLAIVVCDMGELEQARRIYERTLAVREDVLGDEHLDTLMSMNNLAFVLALQGELGRARELHERTLAARRRISGPEHPHTLISMNNLGLVLAAQGDLGRARAIQEEALAVRRRTLGPEHPYTLHSTNNLALVLAALGELDAAEALAGDTLRVRRRLLGPAHPSTLTSMNNLALILAAQGGTERAERLLQEALAVRRRVLGPEHPSTRNSVTNLARLREGRRLVPEPT